MHARVLRQLGVARFDRRRRRGARPGKVARPDLCLWCVTPRRLSVRSSLTIVRSINPKRPHRLVRLIGNGHWVIHPEDEKAYDDGAEVVDVDGGQVLTGEYREDIGTEKIGMDCARKLGLEWSRAP